MPTPVGPVPPDPNDPDLWPEWYDDEEDVGPSRFGWAVRLLAALAIVAVIAVLVI